METWHWGLVGVGLVLLSCIVGYLYYRFWHHNSQQKPQHIDYHTNPDIIIDGDDQTPPPYHIVEADHSGSHFQDSRSATPNTCIMTPLSAPPAQFFRDQIQPRWIPPTTTKSPSSLSPASFQSGNTDTGSTDNNHRFLSLSPFLGHSYPSSSPSPVSACSAQTRTPSPALAKLVSTWKKHT